MDYDKVFEQNIDRKFFYTDYPGRKMIVGRISLNIIILRNVAIDIPKILNGKYSFIDKFFSLI